MLNFLASFFVISLYSPYNYSYPVIGQFPTRSRLCLHAFYNCSLSLESCSPLQPEEITCMPPYSAQLKHHLLEMFLLVPSTPFTLQTAFDDLIASSGDLSNQVCYKTVKKAVTWGSKNAFENRCTLIQKNWCEILHITLEVHGEPEAPDSRYTTCN